ncbi:MAG: penicillin-binding protein [Lachnospiraceae bacterium]|nr:penicillin-binding protein [Lachnospiraceae bacterium]
MFSELFSIIKDALKKIFTSRIFVISIIFAALFAILVFRLFDLQIIKGEGYLEKYIDSSETTVSTVSTRGNIYDRNGHLLAYNELAYCVTVGDSGVYKNGYEKNLMLIDLINILLKHNETIETTLKLGIDTNGNFIYTTTSEYQKKAFLRDILGISIADLDKPDKKGNIPLYYSAQYVFELLKERYGIGFYNSKEDESYEISNDLALKVMNIRYGMSLNNYQKYITTRVASKVSDETIADIMEHADTIKDVNVEKETVRVYNDSEAFAHILGYTGSISAEQLEELLKEDESYERNDVVGKAGIEEAMELSLNGTKGSETMILDSVGRILGIKDVKEPVAGDNVYLSLDRDLQVGIYHLIEQELAGILCYKIVNEGFEVADVEVMGEAAKLQIPIKMAYFQLINNNILSMEAFASEQAPENQKQIYNEFLQRQSQALAIVEDQLKTSSPLSLENCDDALKDFEKCIYDLIQKKGMFISDNIDTTDDVYTRWNNETISLKSFLTYAITNKWINTSEIIPESKYSSASGAYGELVNYIMNELRSNTDFSKLVYKYLVYEGVITGKQLCLSLYEQGVFEADSAAVNRLNAADDDGVYEFFMEKVSKLEITPSMLALDPCSASCVVSNVKTGELLAVVTYPGYDINRLSGTIDSDYYASLINNLSSPLLNRATQVKTAPGSIFKVISSIMGLNEGVITPDEMIFDTGVYTNLGLSLHCWYTAGHGNLNVVTALQNSCNYYFSEVGYRVSMLNGKYSELTGLNTISKYANMFGLGRKSGVELPETSPHITTEYPVPSCIGQGSHAYANIQISRYLTAVANNGTLFNYTLLNRVTSTSGQVVKTFTPEVDHNIELSDTIWNSIHTGMRAVITDSTVTAFFSNCSEAVAGKTGTAEENKARANHATFIGYAPYEAPEVGVTVSIPNGYGSGNSSELAGQVFEYYFGNITLDSILNGNAADITTNTSVGD